MGAVGGRCAALGEPVKEPQPLAYPEPVPCEICGTLAHGLFTVAAKRCDSCFGVEAYLDRYLQVGGKRARAFVEAALKRRSK